jgi:uncharacterized protein (DUF608 family)
MVKYSSRDKFVVGVPLGGIGAGKAELNPQGKLVNLTIANNWVVPIKEMRGFHIFIKPAETQAFFLQRESRVRGLSNLDSELEYEGIYPFTYIRSRKQTLEANVCAFSSIVPNDIHDSTLPAFGISVQVKGSRRGIVAISAANIHGLDPFGNDMAGNPVGRVNERAANAVVMRNYKISESDPTKGNTCLIAQKPDRIISQYNLNLPNSEALKEKLWKDSFENTEPWRSLITGSDFAEDIHEVKGLWDDPACALVSKYEGSEELRFAFSWYSTGKWIYYPYGHYYHNNFKDSLDVAQYFLKNFDKLRTKTLEWHDTLIPHNLPEWLKDAIANGTYILSSSTWLDEKGRFAFYESTQLCPCLGTIASLCQEAGSLPIVLMFPELERSFLTLLSNGIAEDGYVPHDVGLHSLDLPSEGTTAPPGWKDVNPTFILLVYRYYKFSHDQQFLRDVYPKLVKALEWELRQDRDDDGLPELEGTGDTGFDTTPIRGPDSYTSSLFIASLRALERISQELGEQEMLDRAHSLREKAAKRFNSLYNGKYFRAWDGEPNVGDAVFLGQIAGEWWRAILDLDPITEEEKVKSALESIYDANGNASPYCTPNLASRDGKLVEISSQTYSSWPRLVFAASALAYRRGLPNWSRIAKKEWDNLVRQGLVWDQPSRIDGRTGRPDPERYLDHYVGSAAPWTFCFPNH